MPEKTHCRATENYSGLELPLELLRRLVTERRVQAAAIIVIIDERFDISAQVI
jgi:hypothetical protein